jgi:hypothetical protein
LASSALSFLLFYASNYPLSFYLRLFQVLINKFFGIFLAHFIYSLETGLFKRLYSIVSHRLWIPLGKLSFSIFLISPIVQKIWTLSHKQPVNFDNFHLVGDLTRCRV